MLYTQAFQSLYYTADKVHGGRLPVHVRCIFDEFANVALPDDFERVLATCRSREISINIMAPVIDSKYPLEKHPWIKLTEDGGAAPYLHQPGLSFVQEDLALPFESLDVIQIIDMED